MSRKRPTLSARSRRSGQERGELYQKNSRLARESSISPQTRAIGIIIGYLRARFGVTNIKIENIYRELYKQGSTSATELINSAREGSSNLSDRSVQELRGCLIEIMSDPDYADSLDSDYPFIREAINELRLTDVIFRNHTNMVPSDIAFLAAIGFPGAIGKDRDLYAAEQQRVYGRIGGFWHVIRESSDADGRYNLSFLSIKRLKYTARNQADDKRVTTFVPHFSLRSRTTIDSIHQTYRGLIIDDQHDINFIGNRDDLPKVFMMKWKMPLMFRRDERAHTDAASGVITTINANDQPVSMPVVAQFIGAADAAPRSGLDDQYETSDEERARYDAEVKKGEARIGNYSWGELEEIISKFGLATVEQLMAVLQLTIRSGNGKFFKLT